MLFLRVVLSIGLLFSSMMVSADDRLSSLSFQFADGSKEVVFGDLVEDQFISSDSSESQAIFEKLLDYVERNGVEGVSALFKQDGNSSKISLGTNGDSSTVGFIATLPNGDEFSWSKPTD